MFNSAELSKFAPKERKEYIKDMTTERDRANQLAFAINKGKIEGRMEALLPTAKNLLRMGMSVEDVAKATELSLDVILSLKESL